MVRISSNSLGIDIFQNSINHLYGKIAEENPNITFIFSVGNINMAIKNNMVADPAGSKNIIGVGGCDDFYEDKPLFQILVKDDPSSQNVFASAINYNYNLLLQQKKSQGKKHWF